MVKEGLRLNQSKIIRESAQVPYREGVMQRDVAGGGCRNPGRIRLALHELIDRVRPVEAASTNT